MAKYRMKIEFEFDGDVMGYGECEGMSDLELTKMLVKDEGFFGVIDVSNEDMANGIQSVEKVEG